MATAKQTIKLSSATIKAQQALSNKFGIVTFNGQGTISTTPKSGVLSKINVGQGSFKSAKTLNVAISRKIAEKKITKEMKPSKALLNPKIDFNKQNTQLPSQKTIKAPTVLSKKTIQAQQEFSDRFGVPTFNIKGDISTVPSHGVFSDKVNVGLGKFKNEEDFVGAIIAKYEMPRSIGSQVASPQQTPSFWDSLFGAKPPQDTTTGQNIQDTATGLPDVILDNPNTPENEFSLTGGGKADSNGLTGEDGKKGIIDTLLEHPLALGVGAIVLAIVMSGGGKKK